LITFCIKYQSINFNSIKLFYYKNKNIEESILNTKYEAIYLYIGASISRMIFGYISDRIGIRKSYCIIIILLTLFGILHP